MKRVEIENGNVLFIGTAREISLAYNKLAKNQDAQPVFVDAPKFNKDKMYGLSLDYCDLDGRVYDVPRMKVVSSDMVVRMIA